jgi:hypothetical protein
MMQSAVAFYGSSFLITTWTGEELSREGKRCRWSGPLQLEADKGDIVVNNM